MPPERAGGARPAHGTDGDPGNPSPAPGATAPRAARTRQDEEPP